MENIYKALTFLSGADGILYRPGEIIPEEAITDEAWIRLMKKGAIKTEERSGYASEEGPNERIREENLIKSEECMSQQEDEAPVKNEQEDEEAMPVLSIDAADAIVDDAKPAAKRGRTRK